MEDRCDPGQCLVGNREFCSFRIFFKIFARGFNRICEIPACMRPAIRIGDALGFLLYQMVLLQSIGNENPCKAFIVLKGYFVVSATLELMTEDGTQTG